MKKKTLAVLALVGVLAAMPAVAFGAGSSSNSSGGGSSSSSSSSSSNSGHAIEAGSGSSVKVDAAGIQMTGASTAPSQSGAVLGVVTSGTNAEGKMLTTDAEGNMVIGGEVTVMIGQAGSKTAGLPEAVVAQFNEFDTTKSMASVLPETAGYTVKEDININLYANGVASTTPQVVPIKWSGLTADMQDLKIGFYDNATGKYVVAEIVGIDYTTQVINIRVSGSGTARILSK